VDSWKSFRVEQGALIERLFEEPRAEFKAQRFATVEDVAEAVLRGFAAADGRRRAPGWWRARPSTGAATSAMSAANER